MSSDKPKKKKRKIKDEESVLGRSEPLGTVKKKKKVRKDGAVDGRTDRTADRAKKRLKNRQESLNAALDDLNLERIIANAKPGEAEYLEEFVWMFQRIGRLIRATEARALKSGQSKDVYALSTLISQQREIIADIRTLATTDDHGEALKTLVLQPFASTVGNTFVDVMYQIRQLLREVARPEAVQDAFATITSVSTEYARSLQMAYAESTDAAKRVLAGELRISGPVEVKTKKRKSKGEPI